MAKIKVEQTTHYYLHYYIYSTYTINHGIVPQSWLSYTVENNLITYNCIIKQDLNQNS